MNIYCFSTLSFAKLQFKSVINKAFHKHGVASFTDAWIETSVTSSLRTLLTVASFTDAWIETVAFPAGRGEQAVSHLLQMRGLKQDDGLMEMGLLTVASFTDAWIETGGIGIRTGHPASHLLQMRGLKRSDGADLYIKSSRIFYRCVD